MFVCCLTGEEKEALMRSKSIDHMLARDKPIYKRTIKILLLGSGESGKSTFLKQMKIIHGDEFSAEALLEYQATVYMNIVKGMKVLVDACDKLEIPYELPRSKENAKTVWSFCGRELAEENFVEYADAVSELWSDPAIRTAYDRRREFQLTDSVRYFFNALPRIKEKGYYPTKQDILHARKATKGIVEYDIHIQKIPFKFVDVGGQRSQRTKWFQCFAGVTAILFLVSSSEFDQVLMEDRQTNRLIESVNIFDTIVKNKNFEDVSVILFLNKTDLLEEKVSTVSIADYFTGFEGDSSDLVQVQQFILRMFDQKCQESQRKKPLFHHFTTAIDTKNIKFVFNAARDTILQDNLRSIMMQ